MRKMIALGDARKVTKATRVNGTAFDGQFYVCPGGAPVIPLTSDGELRDPSELC